MRISPLCALVLASLVFSSRTILAFERVNFLEPSMGIIGEDFSFRVKVGHVFTELVSIEMAGSFTPEVRRDYSLLVYTGALRFNFGGLIDAGWLRPSLAVGGGSRSLIGQGRRETDPALSAIAGIGFRFDEKVSAVVEGGILTAVRETSPVSVGLCFAGLAFVF
jgi:hypothetical protein